MDFLIQTKKNQCTRLISNYLCEHSGSAVTKKRYRSIPLVNRQIIPTLYYSCSNGIVARTYTYGTAYR